jgi:hypothetical protein
MPVNDSGTALDVALRKASQAARSCGASEVIGEDFASLASFAINDQSI